MDWNVDKIAKACMAARSKTTDILSRQKCQINSCLAIL